MAFLDNLVADLVRNTTGINARGFVRMVGGKNVLLLGGAALAGALMAERMGSERAAAPAAPPLPGQGAVPPPLPPIPASPPPPSAATPQLPSTDATAELPRDLLYAIVRVMVAAALADGQMTAAEKELIHKRLDGSALSEDQVRQIHKDLVLPPDPSELASLASSREDAELLYRFGALVGLADEDLTGLETKFLERLGLGLDITGPRKAELENEIFMR